MKVCIKTEDAVEHFGGRGKGGVQRLADALEVTHGAVCQWGEYMPEGQACKLHILTEGAVTAQISSTHKAA